MKIDDARVVNVVHCRTFSLSHFTEYYISVMTGHRAKTCAARKMYYVLFVANDNSILQTVKS